MNSITNDCIPVAIHGVPRSGTTWIGEIINSSPNTLYRYQPLFSYAHKSFLSPTSSLAIIKTFFSRLKNCDDDFTCQQAQRDQGSLPVFPKKQITHIAYKEVRYHNILSNLIEQEKDLKLVLIIRNPMSVINSWLKAPREFRADLQWNIFEEWEYADKKNMGKGEEYNGFEKWKEACQLFLQLKNQYPERVHLIKYSTFLAQPTHETQALFNFLDLEVSTQTKKFIKESSLKSNTDPYSVYKAQQSDDSWEVELPKEIAEQIQSQIKGTNLEEFLT